MNKNDKASIREVRDLIDKLDDEKITPMQNNITTIIEKLSNFIITVDDKNDYYIKRFDANDKEHKTFWKTFVSRDSFKVTAIISGILLVIITIIEIIRVI